jgi:hypothetical protein
MTHTPDELKAAMEGTVAYLQGEILRPESNSLTRAGCESKAAILRAMLETFDEERAPWKSRAEIAEEHQAGWVHFHPEDFCHKCGGRNIKPWFVKSELWNKVASPNEIWCPQCFVEQYERVTGKQPCWELSIENIAALKQRDEAVRKVAEELYDCRFTYSHPFDEWAARLRAALEGKHE